MNSVCYQLWLALGLNAVRIVRRKKWEKKTEPNLIWPNLTETNIISYGELSYGEKSAHAHYPPYEARRSCIRFNRMHVIYDCQHASMINVPITNT